MEIEGKVAVVTGAARGIGRTTALRLTREGAHVVLVDIDERAGQTTLQEIRALGGEAALRVADVTNESDVARVFADTARADGGVDMLINNAGGYDEPVFPDAPVAHWSRNLDLNLRAAMFALHHAVALMEGAGGGAVVNIASSAGLGFAPHPGPEYAAAKAGLMRLTACLAPLAARGIRVNCICPHTVGTENVRARISELETLGEPLPEPLQAELIDPEDVADAALQFIRDDGLVGRILLLVGGQRPRLLPAEPFS